MRRYWTGLFVIIAAGLIYQLAARFIPSSLSWLLTFLWLTIQLVVGYFLSPSRKRNNRWVGKVLISIVVMFIFAYRLDLINAIEFRNFLSNFGLTDRFFDLILVYCGWAFFQV